jgi:hypothetical protein
VNTPGLSLRPWAKYQAASCIKAGAVPVGQCCAVLSARLGGQQLTVEAGFVAAGQREVLGGSSSLHHHMWVERNALLPVSAWCLPEAAGGVSSVLLCAEAVQVKADTIWGQLAAK